MGKMVRTGAGAGIFDKLEPEPEPKLPDRIQTCILIKIINTVALVKVNTV
jgi:hypothetical protein